MKRKIHLIKKNSFPAHSFFDHLLRGTEHYHSREFELAAEEWGAAEWLNYDTPVQLKRNDGRIFCAGYLRDVPFLFFLYAVYASKADGVGAIKSHGIAKNLVFSEGRLVRAATTSREERIGNLIVKRERVSPNTLNMLANDAKLQGKRIGQFLVEKGVLSPRALEELLLLQIEQILVDILRWRHGYFYFLERPIPRESIVNYAPLNLARAATYRSFSFSQFRRRIPSMKTIFQPAPYAETKKEAILSLLHGLQKFIFSLIDGTRNIEQIARFSGIDESSAVKMLYRLNAAGMIRQTLEIVEYEDREFHEIANILDTLLEIHAYMSQILIDMLGARAKDVIRQSKTFLAKSFGGLFDDIPWERPEQVTREMILKSIAQNCLEPARRDLFIEAFYRLLKNLRLETERYLGLRFVDKATVKIKNEMKNIERYAKETALRSRLIETFSNLTQ